MSNSESNNIGAIIEKFHKEILESWMEELTSSAIRLTRAEEAKLRQHTSQFLDLFMKAASTGQLESIDEPEWNDVRQLLSEISQARVRQGSTPTENAMFILSLKQPLIARLRGGLNGEPVAVGEAAWEASYILDKLGLYTMEVFLRGREQIIARQQQELMELSTPVVKLWDKVLALPLIGTLDSSRAQTVMESLLEEIVETGSTIAIIDISGVPTVDTLVAQHLLKTVAATRLMGADCIISGIRPQIAQTIVQMGINLQGVVTKASLADALVVALERTGTSISTRQQA